MFKYLFFDDQRLFVRENLTRDYGESQLIEDAVYKDPWLDTTLSTGFVFRLPDGKYHMLYCGIADTAEYCGIENVAHSVVARAGRRAYIAAAVSDDGIHFAPRLTGKESCISEPEFPHSISDATWDMGELGCVVEDPFGPPEERYKAFCGTSWKADEFKHRTYMKVSGDLVHWRDFPDGEWLKIGTEAECSCYYNKVFDCFSIITRPDCGERRVGYMETKDFHSFTEPLHCMQVDSLDEPLTELYNMPSFEYDSWYIGMPKLYSGQPQKLWWKGAEGTMHSELAYSFDGRNFQRSLRKPFLCGWSKDMQEKTGKLWPTLWVSSMLRRDNGEILLYGSGVTEDHGGLMKSRRKGAIFVWRLREDGFIRLVSQRDKTARLATRENIWHGGELKVNIKCVNPATVAVFEPYFDADGEGSARPVPGFDHADCVSFTGDSTAWFPQWKGGPLDSLKGKNLIFEIRFSCGELYSLSGDCTPVMFVEARKHENFNFIPNRKGW